MQSPIKVVWNGTFWMLMCCAVVVTIVASPQRRRPATASKPRIDYSRFSHSTEPHRAACSSCHTFPSKNWKQVRKADDVFPDVTEFPEHQACLNCHRQQFFARERPVPTICGNCHVKATPVDTSRHPFPSLRDAFLATEKAKGFVSDFRVVFPHNKHEDASCTDCHVAKKPQGKSDAELIARPAAHSICFTCHNQESELAPLPPNCDACHKAPAVASKN